MRARRKEKIGGGFIVMRRGKKTNRLSVRTTPPPFEHPSFEAAEIEANRLAALNPGERFVVMGQVGKEISGGDNACETV